MKITNAIAIHSFIGASTGNAEASASLPAATETATVNT
jgi:hypothetical protein